VDDGAEVQAPRPILAPSEIVPGYLLDSGEIVILAIRPSVWFLVLVSIRWLLAAAVVILAAPWFVEHFPVPWWPSGLTQTVLVITAGRLLVALLQWSSRLYVLTNRRVMSCRGVLNVRIFEAPLLQIRNTYVAVRRGERMLRVGSIGFSLQGSRHVDAWWDHVADPENVHSRVRRAIERALD
jgi:hypothetical protein